MNLQRTALLLVAALIGLAFLLARPPSALMGKPDFDAFYCAGKVLASGGDPYRYGSMHRCETTNLQTKTPHVIVPAPLPPYGIAEFIPLSMMPYAQASVVWFLLLIGSAFVIIWAIVELTGLPLLLIAPCVLLSILFQPLTVSGLPPIPIALLTAAALAVDRGRRATAAVLLGIACVQPHVAAGPVLATFLVIPRMRLHLAIVGAALLAVSLIAGGTVLNYEYLNAVLPAHALSEIGAYGQYSLTSLLHLFGASDRSALLIGTLQYIAFLIAGIWLAYRLHGKVPGSVVLAPLACGVTGGTFIHLPEVSGALPFAFALLATQESLSAWLGVSLLSIPWQIVLEDKLAMTAGVVAFVLIYYGRHAKPILAAGVSIALTAALWYAQGLVPDRGPIAALPSVPDSALAETGWARFSEQLPPTAFYWPSHVLTFLGLAFVFWSALVIVRSRTRDAGFVHIRMPG